MSEASDYDAFPMPELVTIGDAVCETLQLGNEEDLLGETILNKVRGLIMRKQVTSADVVRLALVCDALRIAEEAMLADDAVSEVEVGYALPLIRDAARRLAAFRAYYAHHAAIGPDGVRSFMAEHQSDTQMFGGACFETRWLGLEIVRRLAQETRARDVLDKYSELMMRLSAEIVALEQGQGRLSAEQAGQQLDERLGLRQLLLEADAEAPAETEDPRIRVFCSPDVPDVFHAVEHANQIWTRDPFDVESVQAAPRALFTRLLERAAARNSQSTGRVLLVLGDSGSGKTHMMRMFRNQVHGERQGYVGYMQLIGSPADYTSYLLASLIDSLEKPYDAPEVSESGLMSISDTLLLTTLAITPELRITLQEGELTDRALCDLVYQLADAVINEPQFEQLDIDLIRALLFLQRREPRYHGRVIKFLRGQPLSPYDSALLGGLTPRPEPLAQIEAVAKLITSVEGGALVLLLDQLEDIYNQQAAKDQFVRLMDSVCRVSDHVPNALVVVSCLRDLYPELRKHLSRSVLDRIENDPEPQRLLPSRTLAEIEALVERRLCCLYESQGVRHRADDPHFPIPRKLLESQAELRLRDVLKHLQSFRETCISAGRIVNTVSGAQVEEPNQALLHTGPAPDLTHAWLAFVENAKDTPSDDDAFFDVLSWALQQISAELPQGIGIQVEQDGETLRVKPPSRGEGSVVLGVRLLNQGNRALGKKVDTLSSDARSGQFTPVAVRCSEFGGKAGTQLAKYLGALAKLGGRRVVFAQSTWQKLLAFREFSLQQSDRADWDSWLQAERPLLQMSDLRAVLGYPELTLEARDVFVGEQKPSAAAVNDTRASVRPPPRLSMLEYPTAQLTESVPAGNNNVSAPGSFSPPPDPKFLRIGTVMSVRQDPAVIELEQLKRHGAFLGASGSGKTSLALNVIEQAAQRGVATILLDRKGDLAAFADELCWQRVDPDPQRAKLKRQLHEKLHIRLFTPGQSSGLALGIRAVPPGLGELPQQERSHLARFAAHGLATMMGLKQSPADQAIIAILGKTIDVVGQLSRNSQIGLRELIELLATEDPSLIAELGHLDLKLCKKVVTLLEVLRINHGSMLESSDPPLSAQVLLGRDGSLPRGKVPLTIISTKFLGSPPRVDFWISQMLVELSRWCSKSPAEHLQALLFLDEADAYLPASSKPATKEPLQDLLKRARSAGLGVLLATQSPGDLDYKARDTIGTWWIGRIASTTAIEKMKPLLAECRTDVSGSLATSGVGEFFQLADGQVSRMRSERSLLDPVQLDEDRILSLARAQLPPAKVVA